MLPERRNLKSGRVRNPANSVREQVGATDRDVRGMKRRFRREAEVQRPCTEAMRSSRAGPACVKRPASRGRATQGARTQRSRTAPYAGWGDGAHTLRRIRLAGCSRSASTIRSFDRSISASRSPSSEHGRTWRDQAGGVLVRRRGGAHPRAPTVKHGLLPPEAVSYPPSAAAAAGAEQSAAAPGRKDGFMVPLVRIR
jgi:hypothetical protein